jgi:hypothetical protein
VAATANIRKVSLIMVIIVSMVAVLLPLCVMLECGMSSPSAMLGHHGAAVGFSAACVTAMTDAAQPAILGGNQQSLILTLVAVLGIAAVLVQPPLAMRPLRAAAEDPPPPPEDPRGARLII